MRDIALRKFARVQILSKMSGAAAAVRVRQDRSVINNKGLLLIARAGAKLCLASGRPYGATTEIKYHSQAF